MTPARPIVALGVLLVVLGAAVGHAGATEPSRCVDYSPLGFCLEWDVPSPGTPALPVSSGGGDPPDCFWVTLDYDVWPSDPTILVDFGLDRPPDDVGVVWQSWECTDGTGFDIRWIIPATPENLAASVRGRIIGLLPQPAVATSPEPGVAAIVGVPVFVEVTNWTGVVTEQECAGGLCVTVTATPVLSFDPGEAGALPVACAGAGSRYMRGPPLEAQATAPGACTHSYSRRTGAEGRPAEWAGSVSVTWTITWSASSGATGSLPSVTRSTALPRSVAEVQAVVVGGRTP